MTFLKGHRANQLLLVEFELGAPWVQILCFTHYITIVCMEINTLILSQNLKCHLCTVPNIQTISHLCTQAADQLY